MKVNIIIIFNQNEDKVLMCLRKKDPYKGLYNFVGGKLEPDENDLDAAYRELFEETSITKADINLVRLMDFNYYMSNIELQVYVGKLVEDVVTIEEVNKLVWIDTKENFFDYKKFAGEGNIGHMMEQIKIYRNLIFK